MPNQLVGCAKTLGVASWAKPVTTVEPLQWPPWGQKKVAILERRTVRHKIGHCREVAVVERWPFVGVQLYKDMRELSRLCSKEN